MPVDNSKVGSAESNIISVGARLPGPGKARFARKKAEVKEEVKNTGPVLTLISDADFCQQLLCDGYVQSYVDFYHLTHRVDPNAPEGSTIKIETSFDDMMILKDNLTKAEQSRRTGNTSGVYSAYNLLADLHIRKADWKTAIFFQEKCLEVSQLTTDRKAEITAMHNLGHIYQKKGDYSSARSLHEKQEELAMTIDDQDEIIKCNSELFKVYLYFADTEEDNLDVKLEFYLRCLTAAGKSEDDAGKAQANGCIGDTYVKMGRTQEGVPYLLEWSALATELGDAEGRCMACSALAMAYETLGRSEKALQELNMVRMISTQTGDAQLQSQANRSLGKLYSKLGNLPASVKSLQEYFELLKVISAKSQEVHSKAEMLGAAPSSAERKPPAVTVGQIDLARALVGITKGNLLFNSYCKNLKSDKNALLDWKLQREPLGNELDLVEAVGKEEELKMAAQAAADEIQANEDANNNNDNPAIEGEELEETSTLPTGDDEEKGIATDDKVVEPIILAEPEPTSTTSEAQAEAPAEEASTEVTTTES